MRVKKREGKSERRILTALIVDDVVCGHVDAIWDGELFKNRWANLIAGWCVKYHRKYNQAPRQRIEPMFEKWAETGDPTTVELVEKFLSSLSGEYETEAGEVNSGYIMDLASEHFNSVRLLKLSEGIEADLTQGSTSALERINKFKHVELGTSAGIDVMRDTNAMKEAFEQHNQGPLITYPGALGHFFKDALERDALISFMAPEKRGKTWWLIDLAWMGMLQKRKVAFFSVGDMSQKQIMRRFQVRAARRPLKPRKVKIPNFIEYDPSNRNADVTFDTKEFDKPLTWNQGAKACEKIIRKVGSDECLLKLACYPNSSISAQGVHSVIDTWDREGWVPDVVVIDYADILANPPGYQDGREATNATWKKLRAMSQSLHGLVATATQSNADSYRAETIEAWNFSEDKRKLAHVTGMVGINANPGEKALQINRLNWVVLRESDFDTSKCVHVAGCLHIGRPAIKATF